MRSLLLIFLLTGTAFAQLEGNAPNWCREGFFTRDSDSFKLARVNGTKAKRSYFYGDEKDACPDSAGCQKKTFVVGGDEVIVNRDLNGFSCVWYAAGKGRPTVGWLRTADLAIRDVPASFTAKDWLGEWTFGDNGIEFTENKLDGFLNVTGNATWKGIGDNVHVGEIAGRYAPENGLINYSDGDDEFDCRMKIRLLGRYLIVGDNLKCGGVNVSFSGVYTRRSK